MSYTPPDYPGQPQSVSPDGRWWWDGDQWRPNAAHPGGSGDADLRNAERTGSPVGDIRFHPGPPGVPNPFVPARLTDGTGMDTAGPGTSADDVRFLLVAQPRSWWTPQRFVVAVVSLVLAVLLGIGLLFWLSINAFERQRHGDTGPQPAPTSVVTGSVPS